MTTSSITHNDGCIQCLAEVVFTLHHAQDISKMRSSS